jgi:hypothetical protein
MQRIEKVERVLKNLVEKKVVIIFKPDVYVQGFQLEGMLSEDHVTPGSWVLATEEMNEVHPQSGVPVSIPPKLFHFMTEDVGMVAEEMPASGIVKPQISTPSPTGSFFS